MWLIFYIDLCQPLVNSINFSCQELQSVSSTQQDHYSLSLSTLYCGFKCARIQRAWIYVAVTSFVSLLKRLFPTVLCCPMVSNAKKKLLSSLIIGCNRVTLYIQHDKNQKTQIPALEKSEISLHLSIKRDKILNMKRLCSL